MADPGANSSLSCNNDRDEDGKWQGMPYVFGRESALIIALSVPHRFGLKDTCQYAIM